MTSRAQQRQIRKRLKSRDARYRSAYIDADLRTYLAFACREMRTACGWTQADLAKRLGTRQSVVSAIETYSRGVGLRTIFKLAEAFDIAPLFRFGTFKEFSEMTPAPIPKVNVRALLSKDSGGQ